MENTLATSSGSVVPETKEKSTLAESKCPVAHGARNSTRMLIGGQIR